jgi:hypothetical protein
VIRLNLTEDEMERLEAMPTISLSANHIVAVMEQDDGTQENAGEVVWTKVVMSSGEEYRVAQSRAVIEGMIEEETPLPRRTFIVK